MSLYSIGVKLAVLLRTRFQLLAGHPPYLYLQDVVNLVSSIDELLSETIVKNYAVNVGSAAGDVFTVPKGKKRRLYWISRGASTGTPALYLSQSGQGYTYLSTASNAAAAFACQMLIEQDTTLKLSQGAVGDTAVEVCCVYEEFDAA